MPNEPTILNAPPASNGAPAGGTNTPPAQANGNAPVGVSIEQITGLLDSHAKKVHDGVFAQLRKAGVLDDETKPDGKPPAGSPPASSLTADDVDRMMARRDALHGAIAGAKLPDGARQRMLDAFAREKPDDVGGWAKKFLTDFGFGTSAPTTGSSPAPQGGLPSSNLGSPANPTVPTEDTPLWRLSETDRAALLKQKGGAWFRQKYYADLRGTTVKARNY
jgi:hypothetical protein